MIHQLKKCSTCKESKDHACFSKDRSRKDGLFGECKACNASQGSKRRQDPEFRAKKNEQQRINYQRPEVKAQKSEQGKIHYQQPGVKEKKAEQQRNRHKRQEVRIQISEANSDRRRTDIQFKLSADGRTRRWRALKNGQNPKPCSFLEALGCTIQEWEAYLQKNMPIHSRSKQIATWEDFLKVPTEIHIDEVIPCDAWDLTDPLQYKLCFHFSNSRLLWAFDNIGRGGYARNPKYYDRKVAEHIRDSDIILKQKP